MNNIKEGMNARDREVRTRIIQKLGEDGYATYADRLKEFEFLVTDFYRGQRIDTAAMFDDGTLCISPNFIVGIDSADEKVKNKCLDQLSVLVRHELLHYLLAHIIRFLEYLHKKFPNLVIKGEQIDFSKLTPDEIVEVHAILAANNQAADWDLSQKYDDYDKEVVRNMTLCGQVIGGLILEDQHPEWLGMTFEEILTAAAAEMKDEIKQALDAQQDQAGKPTIQIEVVEEQHSPEYVDIYNRVITKYDDASYSDESLVELLEKVKQDKEIELEQSDAVKLDSSDKLQAAGDAITAILMSRIMGGGGGMPPGMPSGKQKISVDPKLKQPTNKNNGGDQGSGPNIEIFDPKGLLQQQDKNNQLKQKEQDSNTIYHGPQDPANKPEHGNSNGGGGQNGPQAPEEQKGDSGSQPGGGQDKQDDKQGDSSQQGGQSAGGQAQASASSAQQSAQTAKDAAETAKNLVDKLTKGGNSSKAEKAKEKADKASDAAKAAEEAAKEAADAAKKAEEAEASGDTKGAEAAAKKAAAAAKKAAEAAQAATEAAQDAAKSAVDEAEDSFKKGWNNSLSKFDNDNTSDEDLAKAKQDIENNKALDPNAKKGALDAIAAIQDSRIRPFEIDQETADDFKQRGLMLPKNTKIKDEDEESQETPEEKKARVERIQKSITGEGAEETLKDIEIDHEMKELAELDKQAEEERVRQAAKHVRTPANFSNFEADLLRAVRQQTEMVEDEYSIDTYFKPNPLKELTGMAHRGQEYPEVPGVPKIVMYIDQSGSWEESDIERGKAAIKSLVGYKDRGEIDLIIRYFANTVQEDPKRARWEGGTHAFPKILESIKELNAENVIIMSDGDFDRVRNYTNSKKVVVPGCVWWLWRNDRSQGATQYLIGEAGNFEYWLD